MPGPFFYSPKKSIVQISDITSAMLKSQDSRNFGYLIELDFMLFSSKSGRLYFYKNLIIFFDNFGLI